MKQLQIQGFLLVGLILSMFQAVAQFSVGPKGGVNISNLNNFNMEDTDVKPLVGFHLGAFVSIRFGSLAIIPELVYSTQGASLENATNEENLQLNYFNIPVMLR